MIRTLSVEHREYHSLRSFDEVVAFFNASTGSVEEGFASVAGSVENRAEFERVLAARESTSGFMRFMVTNHGAWLGRFYGLPTKAIMVVLGNPLIAITMLEHDVRAGLNVPVRLYIYESAEGQTHVAYDVPSTLMGDLSDQAKLAAKKLDEKLAALVAHITGVNIP